MVARVKIHSVAVQKEINLQRREDDALRDGQKRELAEVTESSTGSLTPSPTDYAPLACSSV
jgi:hypothetical protein